MCVSIEKQEHNKIRGTALELVSLLDYKHSKTGVILYDHRSIAAVQYLTQQVPILHLHPWLLYILGMVHYYTGGWHSSSCCYCYRCCCCYCCWTIASRDLEGSCNITPSSARDKPMAGCVVLQGCAQSDGTYLIYSSNNESGYTVTCWLQQQRLVWLHSIYPTPPNPPAPVPAPVPAPGTAPWDLLRVFRTCTTCSS